MAVAQGITGEGGQYNGRTTLLVVLSCVVAASGGLIFGYDLGVSGQSHRYNLLCNYPSKFRAYGFLKNKLVLTVLSFR